MRRYSNLKYFQKLSAFVLFFSILSGAFSISKAQTTLQTNEKLLASETDRSEAYAELFRLARGAEFARLLTKNVGVTDVESLENRLDEDNKRFFRVFDTAYRTEAGRIFEENRKKNSSVKTGIVPQPTVPKSAIPTKRKFVRTRGASFDSSNNVFFQTASYNQSSSNSFFKSTDKSFDAAGKPDDIPITKVETDDGIQMQAATQSTKIDGDVTITKGVDGDARIIKVDGGSFGTEYKSLQFVEAVNKKERTSVREEVHIGWRIMTASCPDAGGIIAGSATITFHIKKTITNPQTIGILSREVTTPLRLKGFVNDAAELTHFDLEGQATETISGYERAERLGLIENPEFSDGTKQINYESKNNRLGKDVTDQYGFTNKVGGDFVEPKTTHSQDVTKAEAQRIYRLTRTGLTMLHNDVSSFLESAQLNWRHYGCVDLELTAPKTKLLPAERIEVNAEIVHKFDKNKVNSDLKLVSATESATPEKQAKAAQVKYTLTAPRKGEKAYISVEAVSRRGIDFEILNFDEEKVKKNPVKPVKPPPVKRCDGAWSGKITAVKRKREEIVKPASGRLVREINNDEETFNIDYYLPGIQDTSKNLANGYFAEAKMNYRSLRYTENNYAPGEMMCDKRMIMTPQTLKMEIARTATSDKRLTVYVSVGGEKGYLTFGSPEIKAEQIVTRTYETKCPSYDQTNSGVDRSDGLISIVNPSFEIKFELDAKSASQLVGNKTIQNSDGSETIVTWNLTRDCK